MMFVYWHWLHPVASQQRPLKSQPEAGTFYTQPVVYRQTLQFL
jgi:hypothetical protein